MASPLAILPLPPSRFRPLAPYCPLSWHLNANPSARLAPYCSPLPGTLLLLTGWHPTAHLPGWHPLCPVAPLTLLPLRSFHHSSVTPSRGIALPPWLCPMPWIDVMTCLTEIIISVGPQVLSFLMSMILYPPLSGQRFWSSNRLFLLFRGAC